MQNTETYILYGLDQEGLNPYPVGEYASLDEAKAAFKTLIVSNISEMLGEMLNQYQIDRIEDGEEQSVTQVF